MAYIVDDEDKSKDLNANASQNSQLDQNLVQVGPEASGNGSSQSGGGTPGAQGSQGAQKPSSSGSFTNIQNYLGQNADQAAPLANKISSGITSKADTATQGAQNAYNDFNNQVNSQIPIGSDTLAASLKPGSSPLDLSADQKGLIQKGVAGQYAGPTDLTQNNDYEAAYQNAQDAYNQAQSTDSETGRYGLLRSVVGSPTYQQGETNLDQALLQESPDARSTFQGVRQSTANLPTQLGAYANNALQNVNNAKAQIGTLKNNTVNNLTGDIQSRLDNLNAGVTAANSKESQDKESLINPLQNFYKTNSGVNITADPQYQQILQQLGIQSKIPVDSTSSGTSAAPSTFDIRNYGVDPNQFVQQAAPANIQNFATKDDYNQIQALADLAGVQNNYLPESSNFGTFNGSSSVNGNDYQKAVANKLQQYEASSPLLAFNNRIGGEGKNVLDEFHKYEPAEYANYNNPHGVGWITQIYNALKDENAYRKSMGLPQSAYIPPEIEKYFSSGKFDANIVNNNGTPGDQTRRDIQALGNAYEQAIQSAYNPYMRSNLAQYGIKE